MSETRGEFDDRDRSAAQPPKSGVDSSSTGNPFAAPEPAKPDAHAPYQRDDATQNPADMPLPPARADLKISPQLYLGTTVFVVKDPVSLSYFRLQPAEHYVLKNLDGRLSANELVQRVNRRFPGQAAKAEDVLAFVKMLGATGLLLGRGESHGRWLRSMADNRRRQRTFGFIMNFLFMKIPLLDPDVLLGRLHSYCRFVMNPVGLWLALVFIAVSIAAALLQIQRINELHFPLLSWENLLLLSGTFLCIKIIHEFGHGLAAKSRGLEVHELGVLLMIVFPMFYVDVTDAWMVPRRRDRLWINAGGVFIEFLFASVAVWVWLATGPGIVNQIAFNTMLAASVTTLLFNANPLMRYDGYYFLMDWMEIPNLRSKAGQYVAYLAKVHLLGMEDQRAPVEAASRPILMVIMAAASGVYRWLVTLGIVVLIYHILDPYNLESVGMLLGIFAVVTMVIMPLAQFCRFIWSQQARTFRRLLATAGGAAVLAGLAAAILSITTEQVVEHPTVTLAPQRQPLYIPADGRIAELLADPDGVVEQGAPILRIADERLEEKLATTRIDRQLAQLEVDTARQKNRPDVLASSMARVAKCDAEIENLSQKLERLVIVAPFRGRLLAHVRLQGLLGVYVKHGQELGSFVGEGPRTIVMVLPQDDASVVQAGMGARVKLWGASGVTRLGHVARVGRQFLRAMPHESLSSQSGGEVDTVPLEGYKSAPSNPSVVVEIATDDPLDARIADGMTGRGKIVIGRSSLAQQQWRRIRQALSLDWWL